MYHRSLAFRATTSLTLSVLFFTIAIGLWSYQSGNFGISANVTTQQNRVTMNFDELPQTTPLSATSSYSFLGDQYKNYGIQFHSEPIVNPLLGTTCTLDASSTPFTSAVCPNHVVVWSQAWANAVKSSLTPTSLPNAISGVTWNDQVDPSQPIALTFNDPADPAKISPTDEVKFTLVTDIPSGRCPTPPVGVYPCTNSTYTVKATAYDATGQVITYNEFSSTGTHPVDLRGAGITKVLVVGTVSPTPTYPYLKSGAQFVLDDLAFNMPASSATTAATLTLSKPQYAGGETVTATLRNTGTTTINCQIPIGFRVKNASGTTVYQYTGEAQPGTIPIAAGGTRTMAWDQKDTSGTPVPDGSYTMEAVCQGVDPTASFTIVTSHPAVPAATLTTSQSAYQPGETVSFTLTNTGTIDFTCPQRGSTIEYVVTNSAGKAIKTALSLVGAPSTLVTIKPGESKTMTWDQKDYTNPSQPAQVANGAYTVTVGCTDITKSASFTIAATAPSNLDFTVTPSSGTVPLPVTATYTGTETCLVWDFGDGTIETGTAGNSQSVVGHTYSSVGTFTITLRTCDGTKSGTKQVTVAAAASTPSPSPSPSSTGSGPSVTKTSSSGSTASAAKLVSTGASLPFNLAVAAILSAVVTYFLILRRRPEHI